MEKTDVNAGTLVLPVEELVRLLKHMGAQVLQMMADKNSREAIIDLLPQHADAIAMAAAQNQHDLPFALRDQADGFDEAKALAGRVHLTTMGDLALYLEGYGTFDMVPGKGAVVFLEKWMDDVRLIIYPDICCEKPLVVSLAKASEHLLPVTEKEGDDCA